MPIYKNGNEYSQYAAGGTDITESIERIAGTQKRGKGRLKPAPTREKIGPAKSIAYPDAASGTANPTGISGPLDEQPYSGSTYYYETSSDGLFVIEFPEYTDYLDADLITLRFNHIDPNAP